MTYAFVETGVWWQEMWGPMWEYEGSNIGIIWMDNDEYLFVKFCECSIYPPIYPILSKGRFPGCAVPVTWYKMCIFIIYLLYPKAIHILWTSHVNYPVNESPWGRHFVSWVARPLPLSARWLRCQSGLSPLSEPERGPVHCGVLWASVGTWDEWLPSGYVKIAIENGDL